MRRQAFCHGRADAFHPRESLEGSERTERIAVGDDAPGQRWTHSGKTGEVRFRCAIDIDWSGVRAPGSGVRRSRARSLPVSSFSLGAGGGVHRRELHGERAPRFRGRRRVAAERAVASDGGAGGSEEGEEEQRLALGGGGHERRLERSRAGVASLERSQ
jgi:hypothetical protein